MATFGPTKEDVQAMESLDVQKPQPPPEGSPPEAFAQFKTDMAKYIQALRAQKERMAADIEKQKQQQRQKKSYVVETVYADDVGFDDENYQDDQDYFGDFGDDGDEDDTNTETEEEFIDDLQAVDNKDVQPASQFQGKDLNGDDLFKIAKTAPSNKSAENDFFGVYAELVARTGFDIHSHRDSFSRSVLHFAAEGGDMGIVRRLRKEMGEGAVTAADDKNLQPWQIAVLCRQPESAKLLLPAGGAQGVSKPEDLDDEKFYCALLKYFAPKTATASLAFGAKPPAFPETHKVWGKSDAAQKAGTIPNVTTQSIPCNTLPPLEFTTIAAYEDIVSNFSNNRKQPGGLSFHQWAQNPTSTDFATRDVFTHLVAAFAPENKFAGCAVFSALGRLAGPRVPQPMQGMDNYNVSSVAVAPDAPADTLRAIMLQSHVDYEGNNVFVRTASAKLPVGAPIATVKWMYRIVKPWNVLNVLESGEYSQLRHMIAGDYEKFASTSMVDTILRQAVGSDYPVSAQDLGSWVTLDAGCGPSLSDEQANQIADLVNRVVNTESAIGVHWDGNIVKAIAAAKDLRFVVRAAGHLGAVSDVLVFKMARATGTNAVVAILSGMWCTTVQKRAMTAASVAGNLVGADVIFSTNTFGMNNAELVGAFFEDLAGSLEKVYSLAGVDKVSALPACQTASQLFVPFL